MKRLLFNPLILIFFMGMISCTSYMDKPKVHFTHGSKIPDKFISIVSFSPEEIEFEILVKFIEKHLYHIIIDEDEKRISERWFPTAKDDTGRYAVKLKVKKGFYFQPGRKYRLCIGSQHPDAVYYYTNTYKCYADYEFVLPEKK